MFLAGLVLSVLLLSLVGSAMALPDPYVVSGSVNPTYYYKTTVFANEDNTIMANISNAGTETATDVVVDLFVSDVGGGVTSVDSQTIPTLSVNEVVSLTFTDPTIRTAETASITYTATISGVGNDDANWANNTKSSSAIAVKYNGYKGKQYWTGSDPFANTYTSITDNLTFVYSNQTDSSYKAATWANRSEKWTAGDLPVPANATIETARLYFLYNWDKTPLGYPNVTASFNNNPIYLEDLADHHYTDQSNVGTYGNYKYGLYVIDVTNYINPGSDNYFNLTANAGNSEALYPSVLAVIYDNSSDTTKTIFIDENFDQVLNYTKNYGTTPEEATAYAPFSGIDTASAQSATLYSFATSAGPAKAGDPNEGNLLWNGNIVATQAWQGSSNSAYPIVYNIPIGNLLTDNTAGIQSTSTTGMGAVPQILVVGY
jgi:hypothetical protein